MDRITIDRVKGLLKTYVREAGLPEGSLFITNWGVGSYSLKRQGSGGGERDMKDGGPLELYNYVGAMLEGLRISNDYKGESK